MNSSGRYREVNPGGFSHSEIHGSAPACGSPWLIATCYVLHRLLAPRHSPFALSSLITKFNHLPRSRGFYGNSSNCNLPYLSSYLCVAVSALSRFTPPRLQGMFPSSRRSRCPGKLFVPDSLPRCL